MTEVFLNVWGIPRFLNTPNQPGPYSKYDMLKVNPDPRSRGILDSVEQDYRRLMEVGRTIRAANSLLVKNGYPNVPNFLIDLTEFDIEAIRIRVEQSKQAFLVYVQQIARDAQDDRKNNIPNSNAGFASPRTFEEAVSSISFLSPYMLDPVYVRVAKAEEEREKAKKALEMAKSAPPPPPAPYVPVHRDGDYYVQMMQKAFPDVNLDLPYVGPRGDSSYARTLYEHGHDHDVYNKIYSILSEGQERIVKRIRLLERHNRNPVKDIQREMTDCSYPLELFTEIDSPPRVRPPPDHVCPSTPPRKVPAPPSFPVSPGWSTPDSTPRARSPSSPMTPRKTPPSSPASSIATSTWTFSPNTPPGSPLHPPADGDDDPSKPHQPWSESNRGVNEDDIVRKGVEAIKGLITVFDVQVPVYVLDDEESKDLDAKELREFKKQIYLLDNDEFVSGMVEQLDDFDLKEVLKHTKILDYPQLKSFIGPEPVPYASTREGDPLYAFSRLFAMMEEFSVQSLSGVLISNKESHLGLKCALFRFFRQLVEWYPHETFVRYWKDITLALLVNVMDISQRIVDDPMVDGFETAEKLRAFCEGVGYEPSDTFLVRFAAKHGIPEATCTYFMAVYETFPYRDWEAGLRQWIHPGNYRFLIEAGEHSRVLKGEGANTNLNRGLVNLLTDYDKKLSEEGVFDVSKREKRILQHAALPEMVPFASGGVATMKTIGIMKTIAGIDYEKHKVQRFAAEMSYGYDGVFRLLMDAWAKADKIIRDGRGKMEVITDDDDQSEISRDIMQKMSTINEHDEYSSIRDYLLEHEVETRHQLKFRVYRERGNIMRLAVVEPDGEIVLSTEQDLVHLYSIASKYNRIQTDPDGFSYFDASIVDNKGELAISGFHGIDISEYDPDRHGPLIVRKSKSTNQYRLYTDDGVHVTGSGTGDQDLRALFRIGEKFDKLTTMKTSTNYHTYYLPVEVAGGVLRVSGLISIGEYNQETHGVIRLYKGKVITDKGFTVEASVPKDASGVNVKNGELVWLYRKTNNAVNAVVADDLVEEGAKDYVNPVMFPPVKSDAATSVPLQKEMEVQVDPEVPLLDMDDKMKVESEAAANVPLLDTDDEMKVEPEVANVPLPDDTDDEMEVESEALPEVLAPLPDTGDEDGPRLSTIEEDEDELEKELEAMEEETTAAISVPRYTAFLKRRTKGAKQEEYLEIQDRNHEEVTISNFNMQELINKAASMGIRQAKARDRMFVFEKRGNEYLIVNTVWKPRKRGGSGDSTTVAAGNEVDDPRPLFHAQIKWKPVKTKSVLTVYDEEGEEIILPEETKANILDQVIISGGDNVTIKWRTFELFQEADGTYMIGEPGKNEKTRLGRRKSKS